MGFRPRLLRWNRKMILIDDGIRLQTFYDDVG